MAILFSFSYLPHCHNHSATVGFSTERQLGVFAEKKRLLPYSASIFSLSLPPSLALFTACHLSMHSLHISRSHFNFFSLTLCLNDFSSPFPPLFSLFFSVPHYLCSSSLPYVLFLSLPLTWVPFDETWIESSGVSVPCSSAPRRGCQGKRQALFTLNIIWHLICCTFCRCDERRRTELLPMLRETAPVFPSMVHVGERRSTT